MREAFTPSLFFRERPAGFDLDSFELNVQIFMKGSALPCIQSSVCSRTDVLKQFPGLPLVQLLHGAYPHHSVFCFLSNKTL